MFLRNYIDRLNAEKSKVPKKRNHIFDHDHYPLNGKTLQANLPAILPEFWLSFTFAKNKATLIKMFS